MIIYISGKYTGKTLEETNENIEYAKKVAIYLWDRGYVALCPHTNSPHAESECSATYDDYLNGDLELLSRCDAIVMLSNWNFSNGAKVELEFAKANNIPIFYYPDNMPTLVKTNEQDMSFISQLMSMYRTYLGKSRDYSPMNILGTGELGVCVRLWDKVARLLNLIGFKIEVKQSEFKKAQKPNNESIDDTLLDMANYAIIFKLLRDNKWGNTKLTSDKKWQ